MGVIVVALCCGLGDLVVERVVNLGSFSLVVRLRREEAAMGREDPRMMGGHGRYERTSGKVRGG